MGVYFGKYGIRGVANEFLTGELAFKCGNALAQMKSKPLILVGRDTRVSGDMLALSFSSGAISGGATVYDLGYIPTAGVSYLTKQLNASFGVMISASHNPANYNGIKIFSSTGYLIDKNYERELELRFNACRYVKSEDIGKYIQKFQMAELYTSYVVRACQDGLYKTKVALDCANGACYKVAPAIFNNLGATVDCIHTQKNGLFINENCGSLYPDELRKRVVQLKSDVGFAFDGDGDRVVAVDEKGEIVDGDKILYLIASYLKKHGRLKNDIVVGTTHTNVAVQHALEKLGVKLVRSDIGERYVLEEVVKKDSMIGCEQSGHVILHNYATSADGILTAVIICSILEVEGKPLSELLKDIKLYPQTNVNVKVADRLRVLNNESLALKIEKVREELDGDGRVVIRASETEDVIRIFAETKDEEKSKKIAAELEAFIKELEI